MCFQKEGNGDLGEHKIPKGSEKFRNPETEKSLFEPSGFVRLQSETENYLKKVLRGETSIKIRGKL